MVSKLDQQASLVQQMHKELGHLGIRKTHSMLCNQYWWAGIYQHVFAYVGRCEVCDQMSFSFNTSLPQL